MPSARRVRQAVVVVHGIGQQRPLATMPGYVAALTGNHDLNFGAPDEISQFHDLRRAKVTWIPELEPASSDPAAEVQPPVNTDFYELYWADLVVGSELRHVGEWLLALLPRWRSIGARFRRFLKFHAVYALMVLVAALALYVVGSVLADALEVLSVVLRWIAGLAAAGALSWMVRYLGDVPRYMHNVADNIAVQREVRRLGVELLRRLHAKTYPGSKLAMYDRIVVVGHSLGTVVAYDIVRDYWSEVYRYYAVDPHDAADPAAQAGDEVDRAGEELWRSGAVAASPHDPGFTAYQTLQRRLFAQISAHAYRPPPGDVEHRRWAITDLVTLACPLSHADFLLAASHGNIEDAQWRRQLASCPPRRQLAKPSSRFTYIHGPRKGMESWHQAACFAVTRWTNVYFQADVVGGPLQPLFGPGIVDVELANPDGHAGRMPKVHSQYATDPGSIAILQRVIWDGAERSSSQALDGWLRASLKHALAELLATGASGPALRAAAERFRLLDRLTPAQLARIVSVLEGCARESAIDLEAVVEQLAADPELLRGVRVLDILIPSSLDGAAESSGAEEEEGEEEEAEEEQAEEEQPEEEEE